MDGFAEALQERFGTPVETFDPFKKVALDTKKFSAEQRDAIMLENASPDFSRAINNIPPIDTQRAQTSILVADGQTSVIGGIYVSQQQATNDRTPGLHKLPLLGFLFKREQLSDESRELLIFITPRIIKG